MSVFTKKSDTHEERYFHVPMLGRPKVHMATIFTRRELGSFAGTPGEWLCAVAFCAHGDTFNRRIGRQTARRRYFSQDPKSREFKGVWFNEDDGDVPTYAGAEQFATLVADYQNL